MCSERPVYFVLLQAGGAFLSIIGSLSHGRVAPTCIACVGAIVVGVTYALFVTYNLEPLLWISIGLGMLFRGGISVADASQF